MPAWLKVFGRARPAEHSSDGDSIRVADFFLWLRSTMDSIRASEAPDPSSILGEATIKFMYVLCLCFKKYYQRLLLQGAL